MADPLYLSPDPVLNAMSVQIDDHQAAQDVGSRFFYPQNLVVIGPASDAPKGFGMLLKGGSLPDVFIAGLTYAQDVSIDCGELTTSYHVNVPISGNLRSRYAGRDSVVVPGQAAIYGPHGDTSLSLWEAGCQQLCIKLSRDAVESNLAATTGDGRREVVEFDPVLDMRSGPGRSWLELVHFLNTQIGLEHTPIASPMVARPMVEALVRGLLTAAAHRHQPELRQPAHAASSRAVRDAVAFLEEHAAEPITIGDVAAHCFLSVRTIQDAFARHLGIPPLQYLRDIRVKHAHADLLASDPSVVTVSTIAHRWGFTHLGRFAAAHAREFGESPSTTLRRTH